MTKTTISLSVYDRITLKRILQERELAAGGIGGFGLNDLRLAVNILDKLEFSDDESTRFKIEILGDQITWTDQGETEIEFSSNELDFLKSFVKQRLSWEIDNRNVSLVEKLSFELPTPEPNKLLRIVPLSIYDRILVRGVLFNKSGSIQRIHNMVDVVRIVDEINISEAEADQYNIKKVDKEIKWEGDFTKEISLTEDQYKLVQKYLTEEKNYPLDRRVFSLLEKFEVKIPEEKEPE